MTMTDKWIKRSHIKTNLLNSGVNIENVSGRALNLRSGLHPDAVHPEWMFGLPGTHWPGAE